MSHVRPDFAPSAPTMDYYAWQQANAAQPSIPAEKLEEDCGICLVPLKLDTDNDTSPNTVAQTKCNHLFHKHCIKESVEKYNNKNCPLCRRDIKIIDLTDFSNTGLPLARPQQPRVPQFPPIQQPIPQQVQEPVAQEAAADSCSDDLPGFIADVAYAAGTVLYWGGWGLFKAVSFGVNAIAASMEETPQTIENRVRETYQQWNKLAQDSDVLMRRNREEVTVLLSMLNSMPFEKAAKVRAATDRIEAGFKSYEQSQKNNEDRLRKLIENERISLVRN